MYCTLSEKKKKEKIKECSRHPLTDQTLVHFLYVYAVYGACGLDLSPKNIPIALLVSYTPSKVTKQKGNILDLAPFQSPYPHPRMFFWD
jgi:hypothetical protein